MNENFDTFDDYVMKYDMNEKMIEYKYNHSYRVVHQAEEICRSIELDTYERDLASLIALLHDIARFKQWAVFKTFDDHNSFDHGDEGAKILFDEGLIKNYIVNKEEYELIKKAIINHNKLYVDKKSLNERELMHVNIIRDADKVDILYSFSTNRLLEMDTDDSEISEEVSEDFMKHNLVLKTDVKSKNDYFLLILSLIYDLNYDYSKEKVINEKYVDKIYSFVKNKKILKPYIDEMKKFLKED